MLDIAEQSKGEFISDVFLRIVKQLTSKNLYSSSLWGHLIPSRWPAKTVTDGDGFLEIVWDAERDRESQRNSGWQHALMIKVMSGTSFILMRIKKKFKCLTDAWKLKIKMLGSITLFKDILTFMKCLMPKLFFCKIVVEKLNWIFSFTWNHLTVCKWSY